MGFFKRQKYDKNISDPSEMEGILDNGKAWMCKLLKASK